MGIQEFITIIPMARDLRSASGGGGRHDEDQNDDDEDRQRLSPQ